MYAIGRGVYVCMYVCMYVDLFKNVKNDRRR